MIDIDPLIQETEAGQKLLFEFDRLCRKFLVLNLSGGMIYVNMSDNVGELKGMPVPNGSSYVMVANEEATGSEKYSREVWIYPVKTSGATENDIGVAVQMIAFK